MKEVTAKCYERLTAVKCTLEEKANTGLNLSTTDVTLGLLSGRSEKKRTSCIIIGRGFVFHIWTFPSYRDV